MAGRVISIQADCSRNRAANVPSHSSEWRCSLRRLRLADCEGLAESALCSLIGHAELETLDLSRSTQALTGASVAALQQLQGNPAEHEVSSRVNKHGWSCHRTAMSGLNSIRHCDKASLCAVACARPA